MDHNSIGHYFIINFVVMIDNSQNAEKDVVATISIDTASIEQETKPKEMMSPRTIERMRRADFLGNGPLVKTIWKMTYPDFIAKIVSSLYSLIDSVFIGQYAGSTVEEKKNSLAGVSLASPIEMCIIVALSLIFAQGGGPLYGRYLGKKDIKTSRRIVGNTFTMDILLGIVAAIVLPLLARPLLILLGASDEAGTMTPALNYIKPLMYGDILYNFCYATNNLMRGEGAAIYSCFIMTISAGTNIVFDILFLKYVRLGTSGAALATCIGYTVASTFGLWLFLSKRAAVVLKWSDMKPDWKLIGEIVNTGLSGMVIGLSNGILSIVANQLVLAYTPYDKDDPLTTAAIAASGSISRMQYFCFIPINSIAHGVIALLAFCRGGGLYKRFVNAMKCCFVGQLIICVLLTIVCEVFAPQIATMFNSDEEFIAIFSKALRYMAALLCLSPFSCSLYPGLQAVGRGFGSAVVLMRRSCIFIVITQFIMCYFRKDYWGVFMAYPIADACSAIFATIYFFCVKKDLYGEEISVKKLTVCNKYNIPNQEEDWHHLLHQEQEAFQSVQILG